jgi:hypothetical protein
MKKGIWFFLGILLSITVFAQDSADASSGTAKPKIIEVKHGNDISLKELSLIANVASARDEQGKPVKLSGDSFTIGSYSRSTLSVTPKGETDAPALITLDLLKKK